ILPFAIQIISDIAAIDDVQHIPPVLQLVRFRIMTLANDITDGTRAGNIITNGIKYNGVGPFAMSFFRAFQPATNEQVIIAVSSLFDIASPIGPNPVFNTIVYVARYDTIHSPRF